MLLGAHMSIAGGVEQAIGRGESIGCTAVQIFTKNSNQWQGRLLPREEVERFRQELKGSGIRSAFAHDSYLINLGSPDERLYRRSMEAFSEELDRSETLGLDFVVMHPGAHMGSGEAQALRQIARALRQLLRDKKGYRVKVLLEVTAGQGTNVGYTFEHLHSLLDQIAESGRIGICFDTCHVFAAGYDLRTPKAYDETMQRFDRIVGLKQIWAFHLNDSKKGLNCRVDRHEHIGKGAIGLEAFRCLMNDERFRQIPKVLETPKGEDLAEDVMNLKTLKGLVKRHEVQTARSKRP